MEIKITRIDDKIVTEKNYQDIKNKSEIAHFLAELDAIRLELLSIWDNYKENERNI